MTAAHVTAHTAATAATNPATPTVKPWAPPDADAASGAPKPSPWGKAVPFIGPVLLFIFWDLSVRFSLVRSILLPSPFDTISTLVSGLAGGPLLADFLVTVWRTVQAFLIAAVVGVPLGVVLGSAEKAYRSVEFLVDFFRSTPSSAPPALRP